MRMVTQRAEPGDVVSVQMRVDGLYELEIEFVIEMQIAVDLLQDRIDDQRLAAAAAREQIGIGAWTPDRKADGRSFQIVVQVRTAAQSSRGWKRRLRSLCLFRMRYIRWVVPAISVALLLTGGPGAAATPSRSSLCLMLESAARANDLPTAFLVRVIWRESRFDPLAVGPRTRSGGHAQGIAQFMARTAAERALSNPFDPVQALPKAAEISARTSRRVRQPWTCGGGI